jgi:hypothetical protein
MDHSTPQTSARPVVLEQPNIKCPVSRHCGNRHEEKRGDRGRSPRQGCRGLGPRVGLLLVIDDVWITNRVPPGERLDVRDDLRLRRLLTTDARTGRTVETSLFCRHFTALYVTPETRTVTLRLSVPRMVQFYNFPLRPLPYGHTSMDLDSPVAFVREVTGWQPSTMEAWPVSRVAFGLDVFVGVGNVRSTQVALGAIPASVFVGSYRVDRPPGGSDRRAVRRSEGPELQSRLL